MYDDVYELREKEYEWKNITDKEEIKTILNTYMNKYVELNDKDVWFNNIKLMCDELGYASNMKEYKKNPELFKGNVADVSTVLRVALTSKSMTPDLFEIMSLIGIDRIKERYSKIN
jgi:glutamyl-tRNA synthetase